MPNLSRPLLGKPLSPRQCAVLEWAARGKTVWETGVILGLTENTVASHRRVAMAKLGVRGIVAAVAMFKERQT